MGGGGGETTKDTPPNNYHRAPLKEGNAQDASAFWAIAVTPSSDSSVLGNWVETESDYNPALHLSWGDVAIDAHSETSMVKIHLKKSKCDQFGKGADILLGRTGCPLCRVAAILSFIGSRRDTPGSITRKNHHKISFCVKGSERFVEGWLCGRTVCWAQLQDWGSN